MRLHYVRWEQHVERLTECLMGGVAKNLSGALVEHHDPLRRIDCDNGVCRQIKYAFKR